MPNTSSISSMSVGESHIRYLPSIVFDASKWDLVGEGAVNIVIGLSQKYRFQLRTHQTSKTTKLDQTSVVPIEELSRSVIRIPKHVPATRLVSLTSKQHHDYTFHRFMGSKSRLLSGFKVFLPNDFLRNLDDRLISEGLRDSKRIKTGARIDTDRQIGWLMPKASLMQRIRMKQTCDDSIPIENEKTSCTIHKKNTNYNAKTERVSGRIKFSNETSRTLNISDYPDFESMDTSTLSVELKPKCGTLLPSYFTKSAAKLRHSKFFMKQFLKTGPSGGEGARSYYEPLMLFSGNESLVSIALRNVINVPQNNLRIYKGGRQIYNQSLLKAHCKRKSCSSPEVRTSGRQSPLTDIFKIQSEINDDDHNRSSITFQDPFQWNEDVLVEILSAVLCKDDALARLLSMQKIDCHGIAFVEAAYQHLLRLANIFKTCKNCPENFSPETLLEEVLSMHVQTTPTVNEPNVSCKLQSVTFDASCGKDTRKALGQERMSTSAERLIDFITCSETEMARLSHQPRDLVTFAFQGEHFEASYLIDAVRCFLIAKAAQDVSLFITMVPEKNPSSKSCDQIKAGSSDFMLPCKCAVTVDPNTCSIEVKRYKQRRKSPNIASVPLSTSLFRYEISFIDFDRKPGFFIPKYAKADKLLCELYDASMTGS